MRGSRQSASATTVESSIRDEEAGAGADQGPPLALHRLRRLGAQAARAAPARSRSGSMPQRAPTAASSSRAASGPAAPRPRARGSRPSAPCSRRCRRSRGSPPPPPRREPLLGRQRRQLRPLLLDRPALRARPPGSGSAPRTRPPGGRGSTGRRAGSWRGRRARRSGDLLELRQPRLDPALGTKGAVVALRQLHPGPQVAPEQAAVVDDPGDHLDPVAGGGIKAQLARPGLERVEDDHRPVDSLAEALEAGDQVEREAVRRPGRDADRRRSARPRAAPPSRPTRPRWSSRCGRGCGAAAGRRRLRRSAPGCARSPSADSPRSSSGPRRRGSVKRGKPRGPSRSPS